MKLSSIFLICSSLFITVSCSDDEQAEFLAGKSSSLYQLQLPWYLRMIGAIQSAQSPAEVKQKLLEFFDSSDLDDLPVDPVFAKAFVRTTDMSKFLMQAIDLSKIGDTNAFIKAIKFDVLQQSMNISALFRQPNVTQIIEQSGIPIKLLVPVLVNVDFKKFTDAINVGNVFKVFMQQNTNSTNTDKMMEILTAADTKALMKSINWRKLQDNEQFITELEILAGSSQVSPAIMKAVLTDMDLEKLMTEQLDFDKFLKAIASGETVQSALMKSVDIENVLKSQIRVTSLLKAFLKANTSLNISPACDHAFINIAFPLPDFTKINFNSLSAILDIQHPALQLIDSWSKIPPGIFTGHNNWLGAADQCQRIEEAKYCVARMDLFGKMLTWGKFGFCLPNQCSQKDGMHLIKYVTENALPSGIISLYEWSNKQPNEVICQQTEIEKEETTERSTGYKITMALCGILLALGFFGTFLEEIYTYQQKHQNTEEDEKKVNEKENEKKKKSTPVLLKIFICFSIPGNIKSILSTHMPKGAVGSIMGIKVISLMWVVLGHMFASLNWAGLDNQVAIRQLIHNYGSLVIMNAYPCVDTFFLVGGLLVSYLSLKRLDKTGGKLDLLMFFLHRFLRVTPLYMFIILFKVNITPSIFETGALGLMEDHSGGQTTCQKYWWTNLLYINNFYPKSFWSSCQGVSWYLANDMQFYMVSPVFLYLIYHLEKKLGKSKWRNWSGAIVLMTGVFMCFCVNIALLDYNNYPSVHAAFQLRWLLKPNPRANVRLDPQDETYDKPYTRISSYLIGMLVGYMFSRKLELKHKYRKGINVFMWIAAFVTGYLCVYGPYQMYKEKPVFLTNSENLAFGSLHIIGWSFAVGWVIYACHYGMGGVINSFLSWKAWIPLSRLTLGAYLLHGDVGNFMFGRFHNRYHYKHASFGFDFTSIILVSFLLSFIVHVLVEVPFFKLEKLLLS